MAEEQPTPPAAPTPLPPPTEPVTPAPTPPIPQSEPFNAPEIPAPATVSDMLGPKNGPPAGFSPNEKHGINWQDLWQKAKQSKIGLIAGGVAGVIIVGLLIFALVHFLTRPHGTITVWTISGTEDAVKPVADAFHKNNPGYNIKIVALPEPVIEMQALYALASQKGTKEAPPPDVWILPNEWMAEHRDKLVAAPESVLDFGLGAYKKKKQKGEAVVTPQRGRTNTQIISQDYPPVVQNDVVQNGQVWGVPLYMDTLAMLYDKTKLTSPPATWNDLTELAKAGGGHSGSQLTHSIVALGDNQNVVHFPDILSILMLQNGTKMVDDATKTAVFNISDTAGLPLGAKALDFYTGFARPDRDTYTWNQSLGDSLEALKAGRTVMAFGYYSDYKTLNRPNIGLAPLPQEDPTNPITYGRYLVAGVTKQAYSYGVDKKTSDRQIKADWDFVSYFDNPDLSLALSNQLQLLPARLDWVQQISPNTPLKPYLDQVAHATDWQKAEVKTADGALDESVSLVLNDHQSPQDALDVTAKAYTQFLQRDTGINTDPSVLTLWQSSDDKTDYRPSITDYVQANKDIKRIIPSSHDPDRFEWEAVNAMAAHEGPDILVLKNDEISRYSSMLFPYPAGSFNLSKGKVDDITAFKREFAPAVVTDSVINNKIYAVPANFDTLMLALNRSAIDTQIQQQHQQHNFSYGNNPELLIRGPNLWDDLKTLTTSMTLKQGQKITVPFIALGTGKNVAHAQDIYVAMLAQYGGQFADPDRNTTGIQLPISSQDTSVPGKQALDLYESFSNPQSANYSWNNTFPNSVEALADGKVLAAFIYQRDVPAIKERDPNINLQLFPLPQLADNSTPVDIASYYTLTIPHATKDPTKSLNFIRFLVLKNQKGQFVPAFLSQQNYNVPQRRGQFPRTIQTNTAISYYKGNYPNDIDAALTDLLDQQLNLEGTAAKINQLIRRPFP